MTVDGRLNPFIVYFSPIRHTREIAQKKFKKINLTYFLLIFTYTGEYNV